MTEGDVHFTRLANPYPSLEIMIPFFMYTQHKVVSKALLDLIAAAESKYQHALNESYHDLAESTFNGLRRALPYTRTKVDWNKVRKK